MLDLLTILFALACVAVGLPIAVFCVECFASALPLRRRALSDGDSTAETVELDDSPRTVVLIPAHDEAAVIGETLAHLLPTLPASARAIVIADNCNDETAPLARIAGADVLERRDLRRRGKGYAIEFALSKLEADPPDVVVVFDADCRGDAELIDTIARVAHRTRRPVQALDLVETDGPAASIHAVSSLSFRFKNLVRPAGMARLGLPCHLMGTGMAIPWSRLRDVRLCGGNLAEDMQLGIDLAIAGFPPLFRPEVGVTSPAPSERSAFVSQRTRWEQGHLATLSTQVPRLLLAGVRRRRLDLIGMALDLAVPPLSLLVMTWAFVFVLAIAFGFFGGTWWPAGALAVQGGMMLAAVAVGWAKHCRRHVPLRVLAAIPIYMLRKLPIYVSFFFKRQKQWVRTERTVRSDPLPVRSDPLQRVDARETHSVK
ncbi:MAG: glycosyltransferase family 2 protein [Planctomycetaceae bacterium]